MCHSLAVNVILIKTNRRQQYFTLNCNSTVRTASGSSLREKISSINFSSENFSPTGYNLFSSATGIKRGVNSSIIYVEVIQCVFHCFQFLFRIIFSFILLPLWLWIQSFPRKSTLNFKKLKIHQPWWRSAVHGIIKIHVKNVVRRRAKAFIN